MTEQPLRRRLMAALARTPGIGIAIASLLLVASLALAYHNEDLSRAEKVREVEVQARVLAPRRCVRSKCRRAYWPPA